MQFKYFITVLNWTEVKFKADAGNFGIKVVNKND